MVFHPNRAGQAMIARSSVVLAAARQAADRMQASAEGADVDVEGIPGDVSLPVIVGERDGQVAVILAHPAGIAVQAKHGLLTRAAATAGLNVTSR